MAEQTAVIQLNGALLATLDVFAALADVAVRNDYSRPTLLHGKALLIEDGRHPVVEQTLPPGEPFIPNTVALDPENEQILIITGPNMAGKSVVLRQTGLIVLLAQVGAFVPARHTRIGIVDRIFTRVGASDNLVAGESTFLVEMNEAANILNNASPQSLILLDEIGRGTSTFDGLSIAWALVEYLHERPDVAARTLFATHYHELNELANRYGRIRNFSIQVQEHGGKVIFLRKLVTGGADHSYGIEVARMAGIPEPVIVRAREILDHLEKQHLAVDELGGLDEPKAEKQTRLQRSTATIPPQDSFQMSLFQAVVDPQAEAVKDMIKALDPDRMTPVEALLKLLELKKMLG